MSVRHAILGILLKRPSYPYELSVNFTQLIGDGWQLNKSQVYQTVNKLEGEGLVECTGNKPNEHGTRRVFQVTDNGKKEYQRWRSTMSQKIRPLRDDLLIRIALATQEDADELLEAVDLRRLLCAERLREYSEIELNLIPLEKACSWEEAGPALSMSAALEQLNSEIRWLGIARSTIVRIKNEGAAQSELQAICEA